MARHLEKAKLSFASPANFMDFIHNINLTPEHITLLNNITDENFRQTVRDYLVNQQFRKDYWVKGVRSLNSLEQLDAIRSQRLVLTTPREDVLTTTSALLGEFTLTESIYKPILDFLADHTVRSIGEIEEE